MIALGYLQERLYPSPIAYDSLFIKYEECVLNLIVFMDIVPTVDIYVHRPVTNLLVWRQEEWGELSFPVESIPLPSRRDDIQISWLVHVVHVPIIIHRPIALVTKIIGDGGAGLARADPTAKDGAGPELVHGLFLMRI